MNRLEVAPDSPFGLENLPYGVMSSAGRPRSVAVRIGDSALDLAGLARELESPLDDLCSQPALNPLLAAGPRLWKQLRAQVQEWLTDARYEGAVARHLASLDDIALHLPVQVADYVDFYSSEHHAANVGKIFRPDSDPLPPSWKHLPIGYHGRAGTVVVSGTPVVRPSGQLSEPGQAAPVLGPSGRLDLEAEVGFVVGVPSALGDPVRIDQFEEHVFGACLVNDWSARDIQAFEYVPLGPFLGKSFATTMSAWVVPLDALASAKVRSPERHPAPLPYLAARDDDGYRIDLEVALNGTVVSRPPFASMYWTPAQQLAHLTVNGASLRTGDLFASGTVSGPGPAEVGSLLELTRNGTVPLSLEGGGRRAFLEDGDVVVIRGTAPGPGGSSIGFGEAAGRILPARSAGLP
ncbi:MAG: fumarylacetoacetase [Acidimicrobiales bacterium]